MDTLTKQIDAINLSIEDCKELILEYQKNKDREIFAAILIKLDKYLLYLVDKFKSLPKFFFLKGEDPQELYHIAIIGLQKGCLSLRPEWRPEAIYLWMGSYIKAELRREFKYKRFETPLNKAAIEDGRESDDDSYQYIQSKEKHVEAFKEMDLKILLDSEVLTDDDREFLELKYYRGLPHWKIGEMKGLSASGAWNRIKRILKTLEESADT